MTDLTQASHAAEPTIWSGRTLRAAGVLAALIALADLLFYRQSPGLNVTLFFLAATAGVLALHAHRLREPRILALAAVAVAGALPSLEWVTPWGVLWALGGVSLLAIGISGKLPRYDDWLGALTRFGMLAPVRLLADGLQLLGEAGQQKLGGRLLRGALVWLVPLGFAAIFVWLFTAANPLLEAGFRAIQLEPLLEWLDPARIFLWGFTAILCWPLLAPRLLQWTPLPAMQGPMLPRAESLVFGSTAIRNSLILFNAMFVVQTAMDLLFLWGGVRLPDGMTHADYAHRGAYPLIFTALLAAAFVLAAMRRDYPGERSALIRNLVYLWIAQNVWLVISSILRLKIYVEAYQLSELRLAALVWMGLVAIGLILIVVRIARDFSNKWLVVANLTALGLTLYAVAWIDTPALVARYNVEHSYEVTGQGVPLDLTYIDDLGPAAIPAIDEFLATQAFASPDTTKTFEIERGHLQERLDGGRGWQGWSRRQERLDQYLAAHPFPPTPRAGMN